MRKFISQFGMDAMQRPRLVALVLTGALFLTLAGCSGERPALTEPAAALQGPYRVDTGDKLRITVFDQDNLTNTYEVDQAGALSLPLVGTMKARDLTTAEIEARLAQQLGKTYLRDPNVTVEVAEYRPFFALGEVGNPGKYPYVPGMTAETAVAVAGGFTARANMRTVRVSRTLDHHLYEGRIAVTEPIRPGDTLFVSERLF